MSYESIIDRATDDQLRNELDVMREKIKRPRLPKGSREFVKLSIRLIEKALAERESAQQEAKQP